MFDRLSCFTEEFVAYCLQHRLPEGIGLAEVPVSMKRLDAPERFRMTLRDGGLPLWRISYSARAFEEGW